MRNAIWGKMKDIENLISSFHLKQFNSVDDYLKVTRMAHNVTWETSLEIFYELSSLL